MTPPRLPERQPAREPGSLLDAVATGGALTLSNLLLNAGALLSLAVGVSGVITRAFPWVWLGPLLGVAGIAVTVAGHRARALGAHDGDARRMPSTSRRVWVAAVGVPLLCALALAAMWGARL